MRYEGTLGVFCLLASTAAWTQHLSSAANSSISEVVVTATRFPEPVTELPVTVSVVTADTLENMGVVQLQDAFETVPGLQIGEQGNAFIHIATRGFRNSNDLLVLVDGIPFRQLNGSADFTMLPVGIIDHLEFVQGPGSAEYGRDAVGGVLQVFTHPDTSTQSYDVLADGGSYGFLEGRARATLPLGTGTLFGTAGASHDTGFQDGVGREQQYTTLTYSDDLSSSINLGVDAFYSHVFADRGSIMSLLNGHPADGVTLSDNFAIPGSDFDAGYGSLAIPLTVKLVGDWSVNNVANFNSYNRNYTGGVTISSVTSPITKGWSITDSVQDIAQDQLIAQWQGTVAGGTAHFTGGGDYEYGWLDQVSPNYTGAPTYVGPNFNTPVANTHNPPAGIISSVTHSKGELGVGGIFVDLDYHVAGLGLYAAERWDGFVQRLTTDVPAATTHQTGSKATTRLGLDYAVINNDPAIWQGTTLALFGNFMQGFRPQFPTFSTSNNVTLPQLLAPETVKSWEGGVKFLSWNERLSGQISYYATQRIGQASYRVSAVTFLATNNTQDVRGVQFQAKAFVTRNFDLFATYSYQNAIDVSFVTNTANFSGERTAMEPQSIATGGFDLHMGPVTFNLDADFVGSRPLLDGIAPSLIQTLPSYTVLNASIRYTFNKWYLQGTVDNLTNLLYISDNFSGQQAGEPGQPRTFLLFAGAHF